MSYFLYLLALILIVIFLFYNQLIPLQFFMNISESSGYTGPILSPLLPLLLVLIFYLVLYFLIRQTDIKQKWQLRLISYVLFALLLAAAVFDALGNVLLFPDITLAVSLMMGMIFALYRK